MSMTRRELLLSAAGSTLVAGASARASSTPAATPPAYIQGFDKMYYPGDAALQQLYDQGNRIACVYLSHSVSDTDSLWISKAQYLKQKGWGLFPTYMGSKNPNPGAQAGKDAATRAVQLMGQAKLEQGSVVYLDIEDPCLENSPYRSYLDAWMAGIRAAGYYPGVYGSYLMLPWLKQLTSAIWTVELAGSVRSMLILLDALQAKTLDLHQPAPKEPGPRPDAARALSQANLLAYNPVTNPNGLIRPGAIATQYQFHYVFPGMTKDQFVDRDSSLAADPSNQDSIAQALQIPKLI